MARSTNISLVIASPPSRPAWRHRGRHGGADKEDPSKPAAAVDIRVFIPPYFGTLALHLQVAWG
jgi:hypothetical protein